MNMAPHANEERRASPRLAPGEVGIDNFSFTPKEVTIDTGTKVTWLNHDDVPHQIVSSDKRFAPSSFVLDTGQHYPAVRPARGNTRTSARCIRR